jgi:pyridoxal phosphate enzyme (YggS family)
MMNPYLQQLQDNVNAIRRQMTDAANSAGREPEDILLCAACKARTSQEVFLSSQLPIDLFGENRQQELSIHLENKAYGNKPCHFIGNLQTNKVKHVVGNVAVIESVNRHRLLSAINKEAEKQGIVQDILVEINIGLEDSKTGADPNMLWQLLEDALALPAVRVRGLMAIPPAFDNSNQSRRHFAGMRQLFEKVQHRYPEQKQINLLSMGMSDSFVAAILEGANLIRIGTAIYGARNT